MVCFAPASFTHSHTTARKGRHNTGRGSWRMSADQSIPAARTVTWTPSLAEVPHLDGPGHVGGGEPLAVGGEAQGVQPVLELAAAGLAEFLHQLACRRVPEAHHRVA